MSSPAESYTNEKGVTYVSKDSPVVLLQYDDLVNNRDLSASIHAAYGADGLGLLVIRGVPHLSEYRASLLPLARKFALLPEDIKHKYEHPQSHYNFGWSHGKEYMADNKPDWAKGSYYANPVHDAPFAHDPALVAQFPSFCAPNIWPKADLPELEPALKKLGGLIVDTGALLAKHLDKFVHSKLPGYPSDRLTKIIKESRTHKARLLHYFAATVKDGEHTVNNDDDWGSWCGWHNDHGSLTGLTSAMFIDEHGKDIANPDPHSGLYIKSRKGDVLKAVIPVDCLAYQMGETEQIHSGGALQATPHCVHAGSIPHVTRETFAVFMEPEFPETMNIPAGASAADTTYGSGTKFMPKGVPALATRWKPEYDFGKFTNETLKAYHPDDKDSGNTNQAEA